jgi:hypothetical protein
LRNGEGESVHFNVLYLRILEIFGVDR